MNNKKLLMIDYVEESHIARDLTSMKNLNLAKNTYIFFGDS